MLPLFKGKGLKAYDKDNYRGIAMFPVITKIFEMILLKRLEDLARSKSYFSPLQFGFKKCIGCLEASFVISESVNHKLERSNKVFSCFLDVKKAFDTVWLDGLFFTLLNDLGVCGKMWLILKDLYTEVQGFVTYGGSTSGLFSIGSGQGRIVAPFLYKVFINRLLIIISNDPFSLSIENIPVGCPTFADDLTLLALFPSFLQHLMSIVFDFSIKWRYEFNHNKSGVVVLGESKIQHAKNMLSRNFNLGLDVVKERKEYKNLGVTKNYAHSCSSDIDEAIKKARRKGGMILSMGFDRKKVNPLIYIKLWKQTCLPSLVFGSELWSLTKTDVACLERCQNWFVRKCLIYPNFPAICFYSRFPVLYQLKMKLRNESYFSLLAWH